MPADQDPLRQFNFLLEIDGIDQAGFQEVSGLASEIDVIEYREGAEPNVIRKLPGLRKYANVTLKRGTLAGGELWEWHHAIASGADDRRDVRITLLGPDRAPRVHWKLHRAWPSLYEGPTLAAQSSEVAIETLVLVHEGLDREEP